MPDQEKDFVALFIDWDNLAISTAADLGGAFPDVKRIVQTAQQFGVVLIARAYAEWASTSERLGVYRAGIDTVYAPTFRYENDPVTQAPRGKSLADPCMVADCIDILHLLPSLTTFVIVSGDKDLIPVVRLAQLRGKRVVVIGPDYAAGVLREVADEFISYRKLVEGDGRTLVADAVDPALASRRRQPTRSAVVQAAENGNSNSSRPSRAARTVASPVRRNQDGRRSAGYTADMPSAVASPHDIMATEPAVKTEAQSEQAERQLPDLQGVFATVLEVLRQRTSDGKPRTRATNLKDALMMKLPGFSERRYGFSKFKDFLTAMEKTGEISVTSAGPVHWVSLPDVVATEPEEPATEIVDTPADTPRVQQEPTETSYTDAQQMELVSFLVDLRNRSRWLTYTYVLTNLITHMSRTKPGANAEAAARSVLNQLVQDGVLKVDREPQEVEVGGIKHRVRMCHIQESHQLVSKIIGGRDAQEARAEPAAYAQPAEACIETPETVETQPEVIYRRDDVGDEIVEAPNMLDENAEQSPLEHRLVESHFATDERAESTAAEDTPTASNLSEVDTHARSAPEGYAAPEPDNPFEQQADAWPDTAGIVDDLQAAFLESRRISEMAQESPKEEKPADDNSAMPTPQSLTSSGTSLEEALQALQRVVQESTNRNKRRVGIAGLKAKLNGVLGHFDEQEFGFAKFKDFVAAAENAGYVKLEKVGSTTWISVEVAPEAQTGGHLKDPQDDSLLLDDGPKPENGEKLANTGRRRHPSRKKSPAESVV